MFSFIEKYPAWVAAPWVLLFGLSIIVLFDFATLQPRLQVDSDMTSLAPMSGQDLTWYQRTQSWFGDDDMLLVAWQGKDLFSATQLAALKAFTLELEALPSVRVVRSLANATDVRALDDGIGIGQYLAELPNDSEQVNSLRTRALADPLIGGKLVSADGDNWLVLIQFHDSEVSTDWMATLEDIAERCSRHAGSAQCALSGPLFIRVEISRVLLNDLFRIIPAAMLATFFVAFVGLRNARRALICVISNAVVTAIILALFSVSGFTLNFITVMLAPVVYVVGFAYSMHVVCECIAAAQELAISTALKNLAQPIAVTVATTASAFGAIAISEFAAIRVFGGWACAGVVLAGFAAMTLTPALTILLRAWRGKQPVAISAAARKFAGHAERHGGALITVIGALVVAVVIPISNITVDTAILNNFGDNSDVRRNFESLAHNFDGPVPIRVVLDGGRPEAFKEPDNLNAMQSLISWLEKQPEIGSAVGISSIVARLNQAFDPTSDTDVMPGSANLVNQLLLSGGTNTDLFVDPSYQFALVHIQGKTLSTAEVNAIATRINARLKELPFGLTGQVTGTTFLASRSVAALTSGQLSSLALAMGAVWLILSLLFRSVKIGFIALLPNLLPIVAYFALLGALGISLNLTTSLVACAVFGIAIDDSVHLMTRFRMAIETGSANPIEDALRHTLYPISLTTLALAAGFLTLTQAELASQGEFGLLAAATLVVAWFIDVMVTPALCRMFLNRAE